MPVDPSPIIACAAIWRPSENWSKTLREPYEVLVAGAKGLPAVKAWCEVIIMMGDSRGAPLALVCCLHAATELPPGVEDRGLDAHRHLCMLDLGLATAPGPVALKTLGDPDAVAENLGKLEAWTALALIPFGGGLMKAAWFCLRVAACRTNIILGPEPVI